MKRGKCPFSFSGDFAAGRPIKGGRPGPKASRVDCSGISLGKTDSRKYDQLFSGRSLRTTAPARHISELCISSNSLFSFSR